MYSEQFGVGCCVFLHQHQSELPIPVRHACLQNPDSPSQPNQIARMTSGTSVSPGELSCKCHKVQSFTSLTRRHFAAPNEFREPHMQGSGVWCWGKIAKFSLPFIRSKGQCPHTAVIKSVWFGNKFGSQSTDQKNPKILSAWNGSTIF